MTQTEACGTSMPTSITDVATRTLTLLFGSANLAMTSDFSSELIFP